MRTAKPLRTVVARDPLLTQLFVSAALLCQPAAVSRLAERVVERDRRR